MHMRVTADSGADASPLATQLPQPICVNSCVSLYCAVGQLHRHQEKASQVWDPARSVFELSTQHPQQHGQAYAHGYIPGRVREELWRSGKDARWRWRGRNDVSRDMRSKRTHAQGCLKLNCKDACVERGEQEMSNLLSQVRSTTFR